MIIFISGATSGFGWAMAELFTGQGHRVIATGRRAEKLAELKNLCGERLHPLVLDLRSKEAVIEAIAQLPAEWKSIDVLVNNAGLALGADPAQNSQLEDWEEMIQTNINGLLYLTHSLLGGMVTRKKGHIVNIGSVAGEFPYPGGNVYGATKAFVHQLSLNLRADLVSSNIRVTNIEPGMCETNFSQIRFKGDEEKAKKVYQGMTPLSAQDIAETVSWVISRPAHVNINVLSLMPTQQAFSGFAVSREN